MTHLYQHANPNPMQKNVGDCTVRAIALATDQSWDKVYIDLCLQGYMMSDMPSSNDVWGTYLTDHGWKYHRLQDTCPFCYTIADFAKEHDKGVFIVGTGTHVVCVKEGDWMDTWNSEEKTPLFFFSKE